MQDIDYLDTAATAAVLDVSPATLRSAIHAREDRPVPHWFRPAAARLSGGHVWSRESVIEMREARLAKPRKKQRR